MAKAPVRPAPPAAKAAGDPFDHLAEMLRTLFSAKAGAGVCPYCGHDPCTCGDGDSEDAGGNGEAEQSAADTGEDTAEMGGKGPGPFGGMPVKGMRHVSISIMMPLHKGGAAPVPPPAKVPAKK